MKPIDKPKQALRIGLVLCSPLAAAIPLVCLSNGFAIPELPPLEDGALIAALPPQVVIASGFGFVIPLN